jgi:hypothetical protein
MYQSTIRGTSERPPRAAERCSLPDAACDQLEGAGCDLLACAGHADDDRLPPAAVARFQRLAHHRDVARAIKRIVGPADLVGPALRHVHEVGDDVAVELLRVDEMGHAEALAPFLFRVVDVDADDHVGADEPQPLDDVEADPAKSEHHAFGAGFHLGRVDDRADTGRHAAPDVADLVEGRVLADPCNRDLREHRVVRKGRGAHVVVDLAPLEGKPGRAVGHDTLALGGADRRAEIGFARQA